MVHIDEKDRYEVTEKHTVRGLVTVVTDTVSGRHTKIKGHLTRQDAIKEFKKRTP